MNYGIDKEDLSFKIEDLGEYTRKGYSFQVDGNKTYVIHDGRLVSIVSNDTTLKDMKAFLAGTTSINGNFIHDDANHQILGNFVSEIEASTGRNVESITFGPNGYDIVTDGEKVTVPYAENGSISLSNVTARITTKETVTYKASDILNDENKIVIENYLNESLGDGVETKVVLNKDGLYEIQINGETLTVLDKDATLSDAVQAASNELNSGKSLSGYNPSNDTYRLRNKTGQNYKVHVDVEAMTDVQTHHNKALEIMNGSKGDYKVNFTDKLATFYESVVGANTDPTLRIDKSVELLNNITMNVKYSLQAYENIDHELGMIFNSVVSDIFQMNSYADEETREFYNKPLEEREQYLQGLIDTYQTQIEQLKDELKQKFGDGDIPIDDREFEQVWPLLYTSGVFSNCGLREDGNRYHQIINGQYVAFMDSANLSKVLDYCEEHQVFENIERYLNGEKFENTIGKWYASTAYSGGAEYITDPDERENAYKFMENEFLASCVHFLEPINNQRTIWGNSKLDINSYKDPRYPDDYLSCRNFVRDIYIEQGLGTRFLNNSYSDYGMRFKFNDFSFMTHAKESLDDYNRLNNDINGLSSTIYNYKQYKGLMPFEAEMTGEEYMKFLVQDYSNLTGNDKLKYLDQRELALYQMYKSTGQNDRANQYLNAMDDLINQRIGYQEAAERIMEYGGVDGFLESGWDGFKDGIEQFFANIGNCFAADGKRSSADYRNMFMITLLGEDNLYNKDLSEANRFLLKNNYQIMSSIGQQTIPTLAYFIPGVGKVLSPVLQAAASFGGSRENALLSGASSAQAYLYATLSGVSTVVLNRCMSGIAGLNGNTEALTSVQGYLHSLPQQAARTLLGTYLDGGIRSMVLGEPFDISKLTEQGFEAAVQGAFTAAIMNGTNTVLLKVANGVTVKVSRGEFNSYQEFCSAVEKKMWSTSAGQQIRALKAAGGEKWEQYKANHPNSLLVNMIGTYQYNHTPDMPINIDQETAAKMGVTLRDGESLVYDPNSNCYERIAPNGTCYRIPASELDDYEGSMYIELTEEEQVRLRWKQSGEQIIQEYADRVVSQHVENDMWAQAEAAAAREYNRTHTDDFYELDKSDRDQLTSASYEANKGMFRATAEAKSATYRDIAMSTIDTIREQAATGQLRPGVTAEQVMDDVIFQGGANASSFYTNEHNAEWIGKFRPDSDGRIKVYIFQDEGKSFVLNSDSGAFGRPGEKGGMFATTSDDYQAIFDRNFNQETGQWNLAGLSEDLGGVTFGSGKVSVIEVELPASAVSMPNSDNGGSFYGEFVPGGYNSAGKAECVVPGFNIDSIPDDFEVRINPGTDQEIGGNGW